MNKKVKRAQLIHTFTGGLPVIKKQSYFYHVPIGANFLTFNDVIYPNKNLNVRNLMRHGEKGARIVRYVRKCVPSSTLSLQINFEVVVKI